MRPLVNTAAVHAKAKVTACHGRALPSSSAVAIMRSMLSNATVIHRPTITSGMKKRVYTKGPIAVAMAHPA